MKINISNETTPWPLDKELVNVRPEDLEKVENGSCTYIRFGELDFVTNRDEVLHNGLKKLRYGGVITIEGIDLHILADAITYGRMQSHEANRIIYTGRKSMSDLHSIKEKLIGAGLDISRSLYNGTSFFIEARRKLPNE